MTSDAEIHGSRRGLAAVGQSAAETAREALSGAAETGKEQASEYYGRASRAARRWRDKGTQQYEKVREEVRSHAVLSTAIAFSAGFLIARFLFRR